MSNSSELHVVSNTVETAQFHKQQQYLVTTSNNHTCPYSLKWYQHIIHLSDQDNSLVNHNRILNYISDQLLYLNLKVNKLSK